MANWKERAERIFKNDSTNNSMQVVYTPNANSQSSKLTTTSTNSAGSWQDRAKGILDSTGYVAPEKRSYELTLNNGKSFGTVSYGAYNAILNNRLDKYTPKNDEEKNVLENFKTYTDKMSKEQETTTVQDSDENKDGFFSWLGKQAMSGVAQFNKGVTSTLDFILPTEFLGKYDFISKLNDYYGELNTNYATAAQESSASRGKGWKTTGDVVAGVVSALPNALLAWMTGGASTAATTSTLLSNPAASASYGTVASSLKTVVNNMAKNPSYWTSVLRTLGTDYEEAKERGANDLVASATSIITTALNAGIEVGGGIEKLPSELLQGGGKGLKNAVFNWAKSSVEEGGEEVLQKITTNTIAKLMYDHDAPIYSTTDENAVINPVSLAKDFGMGVAVGSIVGGLETGASGAINAVNISKTGKYFKNAGSAAVQSIIDTGLASPKDSEAYKLAEKAQKKGNKLTDYEVGKLYYANVEQIQQTEKADTSTEQTTADTANTTVTPTTPIINVGNSIDQTNDVYKALVGENLTSKTVDKITSDTEWKNYFEQLTGLKLVGTKSEQRAAVRNWYNNSKANATVDTPSTTASTTGVTDVQNSALIDAINSTLKDGALDEIYASIPSGYDKSLDAWASKLIYAYNKIGELGHISQYFNDGGQQVIEALKSVMSQSNAINKAGVESTQNTADVLQNQSKGAKIESNTTTQAVPNVDKSRTVAYTHDNQKIDLSYKVVSVDDLIASNDLDGRINPNYPQEFQPRDRSRDASQIQITQIASNLNPARLVESTSVAEGSPIVGPDNVVESGNGRTLAIQLAYNKGLADEYRNYIINNADRYGIDVSNLPERPVLVRERLTDVDRIEFTRKANESSISSLSATEQARVDAENLTEDLLKLLVANDNGTINTQDNKGFISSVINKVFKSEDLNNVVNAEGLLSARGLERIRNAIFYKAYGDASLSARLSESLDNDMKNATNVLLNIAPKVVDIKNRIALGTLYNFDFSTDIASAVRLLEKCRGNKQTVKDYAAQTSMFDKEPIRVMTMAHVFETLNRGAKQATNFYNALLDEVINMGNPDQMRLDVAELYQTKEEIVDAAIRIYNNSEESTKQITTPESIYQPESESRRDDDGRGNDASIGDESVETQEIGYADRVQHDSRPSEERGIVADDEQLRQKTESVERQTEVREENSNEERRNNLLPDNGRRGNIGSAGKQTRQIQGFERKNQGKNEIERRKFGRELTERGQVEKVNDGTHEYTLVKPEAYNDDMKSMVDEAKKNGRELSFFIGNAIVTKENGDTFEADGIRFGGTNRIAVRYDGRKSPQKIAKHESIHAKWFTPKVQKIANKILTSLSEADRQKIAEQNRYEYYKEIFEEEIANGEVNIVWEEFVCDVMSGMSDYTVNYIDDVNTYWYGNEEVKGYDPASYATSTDAGGDKYSFSSLGFSFFGNEDITSEEFEKMVNDGSYKKQKGYRDYVKKCVDVYKQSHNVKGMLPGSEVKKIEQQIEGIMKVAIAAKKAGFDIYDDGNARSVKDSKKRLLFSSLEPNSDYVTSSDVSTICDKARNFTEIYDGLVKLEEERNVPADKRFFNNVDNYFILHKLLADKGLTIPCDECYVQALRKNLTPMANAFIELVTEDNPDNKTNAQLYHQEGKDKGNVKKNNAEIREKVREILSQSDCPIKLDDLTLQKLTTADGLTELRLEAPLVYEAFNSFYGQSKPKMPRKATPFRPGELTAMFTNSKGQIKTSLVNKIKATGGFRLQSYGDFQIENFVDVLQTIFEASMVGLNGHAYTKVPAFLEATEGTNLKRNISIFMYEDGGEWKLDKKNSFPMELEDIYALVASDQSGDTGIIAVSQNEDMSAWVMANDNVDYGIPFHKSATRMDIVRGRTVKTPDGREVLGYQNQKDHTKQQTEVYSKTLSDKQKENTKVKKPINIYAFWDFKNKDNLSKKELIEKNVKRYIDECNKRNYRPKFREYVMDNKAVLDKVLHYAKKDGFVPQNATVEDISFKYGEYTIPYGYYKFLGDFGMFKPDGTASPIETLSLENYDFDKAVDFFKDASKLRQNELLQQFENGKVRDEYRQMLEDGEITAEQLEDILKQKRREVVDSVVGNRYSVAETDSEYMDAVKRGDMETAQRMVDEAAKEAGFTTKVYHGTTDFGFTKTDVRKSDDGISFFATDSLDLAQSYSGAVGERLIKKDVVNNAESEQNYNDKLIAFINKVNAVAGKEVINRNDFPFDAYAKKIKKGKMDSSQLWSNMINHTFEVIKKIEQHKNINAVEDNSIWEASSELDSALNMLSGKAGNYVLYANTDGFLEIDGNGARWSSIPFQGIDGKTTANTREIVKWAKDNGYNGVLFKNIYDFGPNGNAQNSPANVYAFLNPKKQLKSADAVTYGTFGKVIPLSERFNKQKNDMRYSIAEESYAPTFYSKMGKVIDEMKMDKIAAKDVVRYLTDTKRGVKAEEIKWSGIEEFLEGKKSVTKAELQEFVAGSQLKIEETVLGDGEAITIKQSAYEPNDLVIMHGGTVHDTLAWDEKEKVWVSDSSGFYFTSKENIRNHYKVNDSGTRWGNYKLDGGENYREITFKMPNSDYSNQMMTTHWGTTGILAHARIQDFEVDGQKMLFIEEIQSDWHNEGAKKGYIKKTDADVRAKRQELENYIKSRLGKENSAEEIAKIQEARREYIRLGQNMSNADAVPDAPFKDNYHEYVLKRIIRMAAEEGYDSIGWTTADIQSERWSDDYAEGYRIEYDQDIPKFLNKYGKKWGAKVEKTEIGKEDGGWYEVEGTKVWSMPITDSMKNSVLYEGQTRYSLATDGILDLEDLWSDAIDKYGTIPKGEIPSRDVAVPKKINEKDVVSLGARTMMEAGITPDDAISEFEKAILDGTMTHEVITNKKAGAWARQQIEHLGFAEALNRWTVLSESGKVGKKELALGMELYNQCITNKDVQNAMKIAAELVAEATNAGQTLQAVRMLKRMTPDGQLYYLEKSLQKMNEEFKEKLGKKFKDIEIDDSLIEEFLTETDDEKRNDVYDKICQNIADQIPATFKDKWDSWRYLAMLGNPRTHIRNIVGNAIFIPSIRLKNYVGAIVEKVAKVDTADRTKSLHKSKRAAEFAKEDFKSMAKVLQGENAKYAVTSDIQGKRTIFKTKWLEKLRLKNFDFLETEDMWFLKYHYVDALARLITARQIDVTSIDSKTLDSIRAYAVKEAQTATYRDANAIADGLNAIQKRLEHSDKKMIRASSVLIEGTMPFKKTPMNIAKQGINYSPVGILKGIYNTTTKLKTGDATVTDVIDDFAKGLSGTSLMLLGLLLARMGLLVGAGDKPDKEKEFDKMVGEQSYAFKIEDAFSYTIDWMTPSNLSLFIGAKLYDLTKDEFSFADIVSSISTIAEPLLELSVFSGVSGVIESAKYSESDPIIAIGSDMITSYFMQALPTMGGQISRIVDKNKREYYYVDKTSDVPKGLQRLIGQASSKIPFASYLFEPAIDEWGREETYGNVVERAFENTVSPGYYAEDNYTRIDKELRKLYEKTGDASVLPVSQQKYYTEDKIRYDMSAEEYTAVKKMRGEKSFNYVSRLLDNQKVFKKQGKVYSAMTDSEKVDAIAKCYKQAGEDTKEQMIDRIKRKNK